MKIKGVFILSVLLLLFSFTKNSDTEIDVNKLDQDRLENLILNKINKLRISKKKPILQKNAILGMAATDQALFLKKKNKLVHIQNSRKKHTPMDRTEFYGGNFSYVGENIAYTYLYERVKEARNQRSSVVLKSYEATAEYFFQLWKNSRTHYKNMIDKDFNLSKIRFSFNPKTNRIYGVQVFGSL